MADDDVKAKLDEVLAILDDLHPRGELTYNAYSQLHDRASLALGALEAAHAEPDDDEREALAEYLTSRGFNSNRMGNWDTSSGIGLAEHAFLAGFRRSARVPVSRDELADAIVDGSDECCCEACSHEAALYALARFDIYPKADRNTAESGAGHDHKPVQHRDGKAPWCPKCGLTAEGTEPVSRLRKSADSGEAGL